MLQKLSIRNKVALGFAVVLVLHGIVAVVAHLGLDNASRDLHRLDDRRRLADRVVGLDDSVGRLQRDILNYTQTGHPALAHRVRGLIASLIDELKATASSASVADRPLLDNMGESLGRYSSYFEAMVVDRQNRKKLLNDDLEQSRAELGLVLTEMRATAEEAGDVGQLLSAERALSQLSRARLEIQNYVTELDPASIRLAQAALREIEQEVAQNTGATEEARNISSTILPRMESTIVEVVQVTRGYLHLLNVVLAGEAYEFQHESALLRSRNAEQLRALTAQIIDRQRDFQVASHWISLVTILIGIFAGSAIGRIVVRPLLAIATTLGELAGGDKQAKIPCTEREDEVGEMARAAEVFRRKNEETDQLLSETQRLALAHEEVIADLERTNAELDDFAHLASHDLRAPLRAISSLSEWIEEDLPDELPEDVRGHLNALRQRTARMGSLLNDLLDYSRASRTGIELEDISVFATGTDAWELAGAPEGMEFVISGQDVILHTARVPLEQVLGNLFSNAVKHHDREHGRVELNITSDDAYIELRVSDDGPGIPSSQHANAFEMFRTLRPRDQVEGSGIGLALVKKHAERVGGSVELLSPKNERGCTFVIRWPKQIPERKTGSKDSPGAVPVESRIG